MAAHLSRSAVRSLCRQIAPSISARSFASASAAVSYESEWEEDEGGHMARPDGDTWGEMEGRGVQWVFMGSASGTRKKHLYANRLAEILEVPYISMGTLVRQELDPTSSIYLKIANAVNEGKLVPEDIIFGLLSKRLEEGHHRGETGFILDGIPRTRFQAEILDQIADIDLVVNFKSVEDCLVRKDFGIGACTHCGKSFDASNSESTSVNPCLVTRTRHSQPKASSATDKEESHVEKFRSYSEQSKQLEEYYRNQKKLIECPGETWRGLLAALHLQHMDAVKLTA